MNVDEPWVWARARNPIVLELQPAYITGAVTCTNGDINITFSTAPSTSLEGWHFQAMGKSTVYKITYHTAASSAAQLDSSFLNDSGNYTFRCFKLDYEVTPSYMTIDNTSDRIDFVEVDTAATTLAVTLTHGSYTPNNLISHLIAKVGAVGTAAYGGSYDSVLGEFNVTCSQVVNFLGASGANVRRSGLQLFGYDQLDYTAAQSYTSTYKTNQISRLIEPFKLFATAMKQSPFVYSTDPIRMQEDYPIALTMERIPDRFVRLTEESDGTIWVRFNSYPQVVTKVALDWIPQPIDLQDNSASVPKLPRADVDTLIHAASAFIMYDKEDSKFDSMIALAKAGLNAMKKKNHGVLFRTGEFFGQQIPRADLDQKFRKLDYGYTVNGSTAGGTTAESTQAMITRVLSYSAFQTASTVSTVSATTLADNRTLFAIIIKHSQVFTGSLISALTMDVGIAGDPTKFINGFNPAQAVSASAQDSALVLYFPAVATDIKVRLTATGANLSALSQGSVTLYFQETVTV